MLMVLDRGVGGLGFCKRISPDYTGTISGMPGYQRGIGEGAVMLDLNTLQLFCDLVETGSFSRAADRSFVTQSAVSQRLRALERECGQSLIERGQGRGAARATLAGQMLYEGAKRLLREAVALEESLRGLSDEAAGTVRVATVYSVGLHALPPRLKPFLAAHPCD